MFGKKNKLDVESTLMHKLDNMKDMDKTTTQLYAPKRGTDLGNSNESLFDDEYSKTDDTPGNDEVDILWLILGGLVIIGVIVGIVYLLV